MFRYGTPHFGSDAAEKVEWGIVEGTVSVDHIFCSLLLSTDAEHVKTVEYFKKHLAVMTMHHTFPWRKDR